MVIYPIFIRLFYFTHQSIVVNTKVLFHFHLHNYYMYKLVSLLTFYSSGIDSIDGIGGLISAHYQKPATFCAREVFGTRFHIIKMAA